ncbi:glyoxylase-like metal-dependent hydrolase (beta-lactamase superfamily II) [Planomicrobium soli]|uniref:Glyoxylase-like metal-dependent hydrolase (Beta-lactamase superfamily II) n=1 Tax=Planomicrobium soli TaxID=1176648 RepID=A0A2P8H5C1_9BACL|nr:glyoxylase-like metal-dependent hydrolase (beta-lactamase superfamily II) [Planomicrobium soli]
MKMTQAGSIYQLAFMPRFFPVNCYLVEEDNELTLVDAALPFSAKGILKAAQKIGKPITNIILTHAHSDHIGALDALKTNFPNALLSISAREARLLAGDKTLLPEEAGRPIKGGVPKNIKSKPDILLAEGDFIGSLEVIFSPGHTPGSISLLDRRTNSLIAGDALHTRGGVAVSGTLKLSFPFPALATWDKKAALESAKKLQSFKPDLLAVGHGRMIRNPSKAFLKAIRESKTSLN